MPAAAARALFGTPVLLLTIIGSTASLHAQQAMPRANESIDVSIVNVDVFVTDRKGNRVRGLTAADFEIRENGRPQPVTNFAEYARESRRGGTVADVPAAPGADDTAAVAPQKRTIVLFIESTTLASHRSKPFFDSLRQLVRENVRPGDSVAVVSWLRAALVRQDFTDDVDSVLDTLDALEEEMTGVEENPGDTLRRQASFGDDFQRELIEEGFPIDLAGSTTFSAMSFAQMQLHYIRRKAIALNSFMENIAGFEGKKIVIMAMHRFGEHAGSEYFHGGNVPQRERSYLSTRRERESVIATANAHNITLYPVYPRGITTTHHNSAENGGGNIYLIDRDADLKRFATDDVMHLNESASLYEIAVKTGGISATGARSIANLLPRVGDDLDNYYSLGYRATASGRDDQRNIRVTTKNRDYVVRSRRQYVEKSDETRVSDLVTANLVQETPGGSLPIQVEVGKVTDSGSRRLVHLTVSVPVESLTTREDGSGSFSVYLASGGGFGILSEVERRGQAFSAKDAQAARARTGYFTYDITMKVDSESYRIAVGVLDDLSKEFGVDRITVGVKESE